MEKTRSFRIEPDLWNRFAKAARAHNRTRSGQLRLLVESFVNDHEAAR